MDRFTFIQTYASLLGTDTADIKSSSLLKSYATAKAMLTSTLSESLEAKFETINKKYMATYSMGLAGNTLLRILKNSDMKSYLATISSIEFLRYIVSDLVCDPLSFITQIQSLYGADSSVEMAHVLIQLKRTYYEMEKFENKSLKMGVRTKSWTTRRALNFVYTPEGSSLQASI